MEQAAAVPADVALVEVKDSILTPARQKKKEPSEEYVEELVQGLETLNTKHCCYHLLKLLMEYPKAAAKVASRMHENRLQKKAKERQKMHSLMYQVRIFKKVAANKKPAAKK